ncbi:CRISPR-associated helicase Cas3' [Virgibacillus sp. LDC-1]|uniref:CRISPR-associated helicase Cas3' n=1 Tax=Virgibacillus sp. LDC-1 TaxID=3039856 RepID=UPI0024DE8215|nr:CRISPR-associated helicase Cas3' [Virgibacillus sp. LDC-1]
MFVAHIRENDLIRQSVQDHLEGVSRLGRKYGASIGLGAHGELAGFLHDMGKYTDAFTTYIENAVLHRQIAAKKIDHSTAGAKYIYDCFYKGNDLDKFVVEIVGMAILSHHSGIQNFVQIDLSTSDYIRRVVEKDLPYYDEVKRNFEAVEGNRERVQRLFQEAVDEFGVFIQKVKPLANPYVYINYTQKLVLSILLDADRTDTRRFEENDTTPLSMDFSFQARYKTMMKTVDKWKKSTESINLLRSRISENCDLIAGDASDIYTLSIPTGGGKTFASLRYALKHAALYKKERIIYVVPYTTILEQNAQAVREIINDEKSVLEHHSNVIDDRDQDEDYYGKPLQKKMQLGRDNWDYPIIFTTMVQFLDAFFQKGTRKTRRLHNLANAIIVFDEVQSVPYHHFSLFNTAVNFLHHIGNSSILLCTATQPTVGEMKYAITLKDNAEMVPDLSNVVKAFERVELHNLVSKDGWDAGRIADEVEQIMMESQSVLIILNTKTAVRQLFEELQGRDIATTYHLSTSMCPAHRKEILAEIRLRLGNERIICISTQLIEAGVDISFETVVRSLAGLDSIAQAAGRCNRHAERNKGDVYIIKAANENLKHLPEIRIGAEVMQNHILSQPHLANDLLSPLAIASFFKEFDNQAAREILRNPKGLDHELIELIDANVKNNVQTRSISSFKTLEQYFEAISSQTKSILVPYKDRGREIIAELNEDVPLHRLNELLKEAQQYSINVYQYELQKLVQQGLLQSLYQDALFVVHEAGYNEMYGLSIDGEGTQSQYHF